MPRAADDRDLNGVRREYARLAAGYDVRWSFYIEATIQAALKRLAPRPGDKVLDVGCGTGALLESVSRASPGACLSGVDLSPEMLAVASARLGGSAELSEGRADNLPFTDAAFDMVVSTSVLHYLRRPDAALTEMERVLKPGGRAVVVDWCHDYLACRGCDFFLHLFNRAHGRTFGRAACERFMLDAGFEQVGVEAYKINWLWGLMTASGTKGDRRTGRADGHGRLSRRGPMRGALNSPDNRERPTRGGTAIHP